MASMEPCMVRQIVAHFGQPGYQSFSDTYINKTTAKLDFHEHATQKHRYFASQLEKQKIYTTLKWFW